MPLALQISKVWYLHYAAAAAASWSKTVRDLFRYLVYLTTLLKPSQPTGSNSSVRCWWLLTLYSVFYRTAASTMQAPPQLMLDKAVTSLGSVFLSRPNQGCHHKVGAYCCCLITGCIGCVTWLESGPMHTSTSINYGKERTPRPWLVYWRELVILLAIFEGWTHPCVYEMREKLDVTWQNVVLSSSASLWGRAQSLHRLSLQMVFSDAHS